LQNQYYKTMKYVDCLCVPESCNKIKHDDCEIHKGLIKNRDYGCTVASLSWILS